MRKKKKFFGDYQLVKRGDTIYIRKYPQDYALWNKTHDIRHMHPNKVRTWLGFAKVGQSVRGEPYDEVIITFIEKLRGRKYSPEKPPKIIPLKDFIGLKLQALEKGLKEEVVDAMAVPAEFVGVKPTVEEKKRELAKALVKIRQPLEV